MLGDSSNIASNELQLLPLSSLTLGYSLVPSVWIVYVDKLSRSPEYRWRSSSSCSIHNKRSSIVLSVSSTKRSSNPSRYKSLRSLWFLDATKPQLMLRLVSESDCSSATLSFPPRCSYSLSTQTAQFSQVFYKYPCRGLACKTQTDSQPRLIYYKLRLQTVFFLYIRRTSLRFGSTTCLLRLLMDTPLWKLLLPFMCE